MSITSNTSDLQDILNMAQMIGGDSDGGTTVAQNTFQIKKGTCRYTTTAYNNNYSSVSVNCGFKADLVIFYLGIVTDPNAGGKDRMSVGFALDQLHYDTTGYDTSFGFYMGSSYGVYFYMNPNNNGFEFLAIQTDGSSAAAYTSNINYVAYQFNYAT